MGDICKKKKNLFVFLTVTAYIQTKVTILTDWSLLHLGIWIFRWIGPSFEGWVRGLRGFAGICFGFWDMMGTTVVSLAPDGPLCQWSALPTTRLQLCVCVCLLSTWNKWVCLRKGLKPLVKWGKCGHRGWERGNIKLSRRKWRFGMRLWPFGWFVYMHAVHFGMASYNYIKAENDGKKDERMLEIVGLYFLGLK